MRKWKLLLSTFGIITPFAIATPFIVGCSGKEKQAQIEEKQYRFYVSIVESNPLYTTYKVHKQVLDGYDNYFQPIWKDLDYGKTIKDKDWNKFVEQAKEQNIPIVFEENTIQ